MTSGPILVFLQDPPLLGSRPDSLSSAITSRLITCIGEAFVSLFGSLPVWFELERLQHQDRACGNIEGVVSSSNARH